MLKVLLIDDDDDDRFFFKKALQRIEQPVEYLQADGCHAAFDLIKENVTPDIIFLDINMPEENGYTCLSILQKNIDWNHIPVIIYTTSGSTNDVEKALEINATGYLKKPDNIQALSKNIELLLSRLKNNSI